MAAALFLGIASQIRSDSAAPRFADKGTLWTNESRKEFYSRDQGSRLMPLSCIRALKHTDGSGFLEDAPGRYG